MLSSSPLSFFLYTIKFGLCLHVWAYEVDWARERELSGARSTLNREFQKLRRQLQRKRHIKIEVWVKLSLLRLFHVGYVVQNRSSALSLAWPSGFHVKAKNERFTAASSHCLQNLKYENLTPSFARIRQNIAPKSVPHVQHDYFPSLYSTNQIIDLWRCRWRGRRQVLSSLLGRY